MEVSVANPQSVAPLAPNQVLDANASQPPGFVQRVMALPAQRKLMLGGGIAAIVAIFVAMMLWGRDGGLPRSVCQSV
jgi:flagellar M-ring protein FliF